MLIYRKKLEKTSLFSFPHSFLNLISLLSPVTLHGLFCFGPSVFQAIYLHDKPLKAFSLLSEENNFILTITEGI